MLAALCAVMAALLTLVYLGGRSSARESDPVIIWVARQQIPPGAHLSEEMLQRVQVDGPTRQLLAREALPASPADTPAQWYASVLIEPGQPLVPGRNVSAELAPSLPEGTPPADLRVVALLADELPTGAPRPGEEVDIYVIIQGSDAIRILDRTRVMTAEQGLIEVLVPEPKVADVLTAAEGASVKVVRHLPRVSP